MPIENPRQLRGLAILARGNQIKRIDACTYRVASQSGNGSYLVQRHGLAKTMPSFVVTDGLRAYQDAFNKEFFTLRNPRTMHVRLAGLRKETNNNIIERLHGTIRERTKVMRGLDNENSAQTIIDGNRIYYNFIRPHMALNGLTPAEVANINLRLEQNKWESLIRRSVKYKNGKLGVN
jgi:hypothetical protein